MAQRTVGVCLLGCGVVGAGVARILVEQRDLLRQRTGLLFEIRHIVARDARRERGVPGIAVATDAAAAIADPGTDVVVELIGGITAAGDYVEKALLAGKPVVTANKSLLAAQGPRLFSLARKHNTCIAFEASCAGGVPVIGALTGGLIANRIDALVGIVNGTCNFILTKMSRNGWSYAHALAEAQKAGFAEADPTLDVSGRDAAQKLALLASLAFNVRVAESDIHIEGIDNLDEADIRLAHELRYVIKLLAIAQRHGHRISLRVHPTLVHRDDVLAEVSGSFNAVSVYGHALGHALFYGRGAGSMPTASAVVADLVNVGLGVAQLTFGQLNVFPDQIPAAALLPFNELTSRYYLRLTASNEPGVLAQVTRILGEKEISLAAVSQHEATDARAVPVVITTHLAREGAIQSAIDEINRLPSITPPTVCLRIIDQPVEFAGS
jgi:homoserine dehydrogenase